MRCSFFPEGMLVSLCRLLWGYSVACCNAECGRIVFIEARGRGGDRVTDVNVKLPLD